MLKRINNTHVTQQCAECGTERDVPITDLTVGEGAPDILAFPPCPTCSAAGKLTREFGQRERQEDPPESYDSPVNGAINWLHRKAVENGQFSQRGRPADLDKLRSERSKGRWPGRQPKRVVEPTTSEWVDLRPVVEVTPVPTPPPDDEPVQ